MLHFQYFNIQLCRKRNLIQKIRQFKTYKKASAKVNGGQADGRTYLIFCSRSKDYQGLQATLDFSIGKV